MNEALAGENWYEGHAEAGNDTIKAGDGGDDIAGGSLAAGEGAWAKVTNLAKAWFGGKAVAGDDTIHAGFGGDKIAGDALATGKDGKAVANNTAQVVDDEDQWGGKWYDSHARAGNDTINAGQGHDSDCLAGDAAGTHHDAGSA